VALAAAALLAGPAMLVAPGCARLASRVSERVLRGLFMTTLLLIAARMLFNLGG
jgi:uncharacterized membrane protein YfcA